MLKYIKACRPKLNINLDSSDDQLINELNALLKYASKNKKGKQLRHAGQHNQRPLKNKNATLRDTSRANFYSWLYQKTLGSLRAFKYRSTYANTEKDYFEISEILAKSRYQEAKKTVPAYKRHLQTSAQNIKIFADIPPTSKSNFIKPNTDHDYDLHKQGLYPKSNVETAIDTTDKSTVWVRGEAELKSVKKSLLVTAEMEYGKRPLNYINAFELDSLATDKTINEIMRDTGTVFAAGTDKEKIVERLESIYKHEQKLLQNAVEKFIRLDESILPSCKKQALNVVSDAITELLLNKPIDYLATFYKIPGAKLLSKIDPYLYVAFVSMLTELNNAKSQIIIAGDPTFLKDLADTVGDNFKKYYARGVINGQKIDETLRDQLIKAGFSHINSSYGASDLDINIGVETDFEIGLRKALELNPALANELYGNNKCLPMIFRYDPFNYHIEVNADDELIFTCNRNDRSSPRIRYDLGDKGRVFAASDIQALLIKHDIHHLQPKMNLPLLFVWGQDSVALKESKQIKDTEELQKVSDQEDKKNLKKKKARRKKDNIEIIEMKYSSTRAEYDDSSPRFMRAHNKNNSVELTGLGSLKKRSK